MDAGDIVAISEGVLLAGTWVWVLRVKRSWPGWREKSAIWGFICASVAILADLVLTVVMHLRGESAFAGILFLATIVASVLLGLAGIVLGTLGKGTPRLATLAWSLVVLASVAVTAVSTLVAMTE